MFTRGADVQATETTLQKVLAGTRVFELPFFQRRYRWSGKNWEELWEDFLEQYDHPDVVAGALPPNQGHFLGSIVLHPAGGPVSTVAKYLLVDGQQRITTFLALLAAFRDFRASKERTWNPAAYDDQFLTNPYNPKDLYRLVPTVKDRHAYRLTLHEKRPTGQIGRAYRYFLREIRRLAARDENLDFTRFENALLLRMLVVEITTSPTDDVNHIFHTLNASGETLSPLDLVRNHAFMQVPQEAAEEIHSSWMDIEARLGEPRMERYLWAQFVRTNPKASQRNLYSAFQLRLKTNSAVTHAPMADVVAAEIDRLQREAVLYEVIESPGDDRPELRSGLIPPALMGPLRELHEWGSLVHLPLSLELLSRFADGKADEATVAEALRHILSYLVRRALCAIPTNNLNRIFAGLPIALNERDDVADQVALLLGTEQRYWPTDRQVRDRVRTAPLQLGARGGQTRFILSRLEAVLRGEEEPMDDALVVHPVLPTTLTPSWREYLAEHDPQGVDEALTRTHTLGNLVLVPSGMRLGRSTFEQLRLSLPNDWLVNERVHVVDEWNTEVIDERSAALCDLAIEVWRRPQSLEAEDGPEWENRLSEVLLEMPADSWTTIDSLSEFLAERPDSLMAALEDLEPVLAVRVLDVDGRLPAWLSPKRRDVLSSQLEEAGYDAGGTIYGDAGPLTAIQLQEILEQDTSDDE